MFKRRGEWTRDVDVIAVTVNKNMKATQMSALSRGSCYTEIINPYTTVLYTANGQLKTRDFDGVWTLEQVKNWISEKV